MRSVAVSYNQESNNVDDTPEKTATRPRLGSQSQMQHLPVSENHERDGDLYNDRPHYMSIGSTLRTREELTPSDWPTSAANALRLSWFAELTSPNEMMRSSLTRPCKHQVVNISWLQVDMQAHAVTHG